jgi:hypothetical protein
VDSGVEEEEEEEGYIPTLGALPVLGARGDGMRARREDG